MQQTLKSLAKQAKNRVKNGFWQTCQTDFTQKLERAKEQGLNQNEAGRYLKNKVSSSISGEKEDEFYLKVKEMLTEEGEVSDAIGRLTDKQYYASLSYEEKQRYTLTLSERYLRALERFRKECAFDALDERA